MELSPPISFTGTLRNSVSTSTLLLTNLRRVAKFRENRCRDGGENVWKLKKDVKRGSVGNYTGRPYQITDVTPRPRGESDVR